MKYKKPIKVGWLSVGRVESEGEAVAARETLKEKSIPVELEKVGRYWFIKSSSPDKAIRVLIEAGREVYVKREDLSTSPPLTSKRKDERFIPGC